MLPRARAYLADHGHFTLSIITRYAILRGLKAKGADRQIEVFETLGRQSSVLPLSDEAVARAGQVHADLSNRGELIGDADILIAASALLRGHGVATNNQSHFGRIEGLLAENWMAPKPAAGVLRPCLPSASSRFLFRTSSNVSQVAELRAGASSWAKARRGRSRQPC